MGSLYIVATPIGNLEDMTLRAIRVLKEVDLILCEDTRTTKHLLSRYEIFNKQLSIFNDKPSGKTIEQVIALLEEGKNIALVSDAGTPAISDPGSLLIKKIREHFQFPRRPTSGKLEEVSSVIKIVAVPGASALTAAYSISGITGGEFVYLGFLPHKKGRETLFKEIAAADRTYIFYESSHRILKTLESLQKFAPDKKVSIAREMTKMFEEFISGSAIELLEILQKNPKKQKGEFVVMVEA